MKLKYTKEFLKNLEQILKNNKSFSNKIEKIIFNLKKNWLWLVNYQIYDIKKLTNMFFRLKIIPYRIILKKEWDVIIFDNIFIRKWKTDYKRYKK